MSIPLASEPRAPLASALQRAGAWLVEPAHAEDPPLLEAVEEPPPRPVVAVAGLAARCGTTTVARGLGAELASRDAGGAAAVVCSGSPGAAGFGGRAALRLQRVLAGVAPQSRTAGRLCLVEDADLARLAATVAGAAPLVVDAGFGLACGTAARLADAVILVATPAVSPALADVVADSLGQVGPRPLVALNRGYEVDGWDERAAVRLPESRAGARLALGGRELRRSFGLALSELADRCLGPA